MNHRQALCVSFFAMFGLFVSSTAMGLVAEPASLLINTHNSVSFIRLIEGGQPLAQSDFIRSKFMVNDSNYGRMVTVTPEVGGVRVAPTEAMEVGTYTLIIETKKGVVYVPVNVPLSGEASVLDERTEALGGARDEAMKDIGLATELPRGDVHFKLHPRYRVGQSLQLSAPVAPGVLYRWSVNGAVVAEFSPSMSYVFPVEGDYIVRLEQGGGNSAWRTTCEASTLVEEAPASVMTSKKGQRISFVGPEGFGKYSWHLDAKPMGEQRSIALAFPASGRYVLVCRCEQPTTGAADTFFNARYEITVP